jgi:hypothetical protein
MSGWSLIRHTHFRDLPAPTRTPPYRLDLKAAIHIPLKRRHTVRRLWARDMCG